MLNIKNTLYGGKLIQFANCAGIALGTDYDCQNPPVAGVEKRLILFSRKDIQSVTFDIVDTSLITDITLVTGTQGYEFFQFRNSLIPQYSLVTQAVSIGYDHQVAFNVWEITQAQKDNLQAMAVVKTVGIVENIVKGESTFEVYGLGSGLEASEIIRIATDVDTAGSFAVTLKTSDDGSKEPRMPQTWFDTDYATTKLLVDALLTAI